VWEVWEVWRASPDSRCVGWRQMPSSGGTPSFFNSPPLVFLFYSSEAGEIDALSGYKVQHSVRHSISISLAVWAALTQFHHMWDSTKETAVPIAPIALQLKSRKSQVTKDPLGDQKCIHGIIAQVQTWSLVNYLDGEEALLTGTPQDHTSAPASKSSLDIVTSCFWWTTDIYIC